MSAPQRTYRVYCYDAAHKILTNDLLEAASDEAAIAEAKAMGFGTKCEIWEGTRLVAQLEDERRHASG
jgi:hypothetical protein